MKGLIFTTGTPDTEKLVRSFTCLGHETRVVQYDVNGVDVAAIAEETRADVGIYIGAMAAFHNGAPVPSTDILCRANRAVPMIHLCSDSADPPWWPLLEEYNAAGAFRLQVGIDGCRDSPMARFGRIALTPVDPNWFPQVAWGGRPYICGFAGGGGARTPMLQRLKGSGLVWMNEGGYVAYDLVCQFYANCRLVLNDAKTGTGQKRHIKGRFVEASLAGAVIIEPHDSPAADWFQPGVDYLVWSSVDDTERYIRNHAVDHGRNEEMGRLLRSKMLAEHAAPVFWRKLLSEIGL